MYAYLVNTIQYTHIHIHIHIHINIKDRKRENATSKQAN